MSNSAEEAVSEDPPRTLLPRFSIRALLWLVTCSALVFVVFGMAARGEAWAVAVSIGIASLVLMAIMHALWFFLVRFFGRIVAPSAKDVA